MSPVRFFRRLLLSALLMLPLSAPALSAEVPRAAPDFSGGGAWFNSPPLSIGELRGKVVLVNVWVYSCINCHRSLPTLRAWYSKFKDRGLEIVGVHTPEFDSDRAADHLKPALQRDRVTWPVVQDNDRAIWNAYGNEFWPSFYLIDRQGRIRAVHAGEISDHYPGQRPELEKTLEKLLAEPAGS